MIRSTALVLLLSGAAFAQSASFVTFGTACAYETPPLTASTLPRLGTTFVVETLSGGRTGGYEGGVSSVLFIGLSRSSVAGVALPIPPSAFQRIGIGACGDLSVSTELVLSMPYHAPRRTVATAIPIPSSPQLIGSSLYLQAMDVRLNRHLRFSLIFGVAGAARIGT